MKRLPLITIAGTIAFAIQSWSAPVDAITAAAAIKGWIQSDHTPLGVKLGNQVGKVETYKDTTGSVLYYVVHLKPTGIVIVSADDQVEPVIAFASQNTFDPSTKSPLGTLISRDLPQRVASARLTLPDGTVGTKNQKKWSALQLAATSSTAGISPNSIANNNLTNDLRVAPLIQTSWNQGTADNTLNGPACYNFFTPPHESGNPNNALCGCVATAMAQLMYYYQYPVTGVGTPSFTFSFDGSMAQWPWPLRGGDGFGGPYQWEDMPTNPINATLTQRMAIGSLTFDAGIAANMAYSDTTLGSVTYLTNAQTALLGAFMFSNAIIFESVTNINLASSLVSMINPNLDAGQPVIFTVQNSIEGHCIVCDGYGYSYATLYHHLNMGWGGSDNAWYHLPFIDLADTPPFYNIDGCLYNISPTAKGEIISGRVLDNNNAPAAGINITATDRDNNANVYYATTGTNGIYALTTFRGGTVFTIAVNNTNNGHYYPSFAIQTGVSTNNSSCGNVWLGMTNIILKVPPELSFKINPQDTNIYIHEGSNATFYVVADGGTLSYQWQYSNNVTANWTNVTNNAFYSGSKAAVLNITNATMNMNGSFFHCIVSSYTNSITSTPAKLTVIGMPPEFKIPPADQIVNIGSSAAFISLVDGSQPIGCQWQYSNNVTASWANVVDNGIYSGSQTTNLNINSVSFDMNGMFFKCIATNFAGATSSPSATITVTGTAPSFAMQPADQNVNNGAIVIFAAYGQGSQPINYQWQYRTNGIASWINITDAGSYSGSQTTNLTINSVTPSMDGWLFQCVATNYFGITNSATSRISLLGGAPVFIVQPTNQMVNLYTNAFFAAVAIGAEPIEYQWQYSNNGTANWANVPANGIYSGSQTTNLIINSVTPDMSGMTFQCIASNAFGRILGTPVRLTVLGLPTFNLLPTNQLVNIDTISNAFFGAAAIGLQPIGYQWQYSNNVTANWANVPTTAPYVESQSNNLSITPVTPDMSGTIFQCVASNAIGSTTSMPPALLTITGSPPSFTTSPTNQVVNIESNVVFTAAAIRSPTNGYQWQYRNGATTNWIFVANGGIYSGSRSPILAIASASYDMNGTLYRCLATNTFGTNYSLTGLLTITGTGPSFLLNPSSQTIYYSSNVVFSAVATHGAVVSYQWQYSNNVTGNWTNMPADNIYSGALTTNLTINAVNAEMDGMNIQCIATNPWGRTNSLTAVLTTIPNHSTPISISTLAGMAQTNGAQDGTNGSALFNSPRGLAVNSQTNIYVADTGNNVIRQITLTHSGWQVNTIAGLAGSFGTNDGDGATARFNAPIGIAIDTNTTNLYVTDTFNQTVRMLSPKGTNLTVSTNWKVSTIAGHPGTYGITDGTNSLFKFPMGIAYDTTSNCLYVADEGNHTIRKLALTTNGSSTTTTIAYTIAGIAGILGTNDGPDSTFGNPYGLTICFGNKLAITDQYFNTVRLLDLNSGNVSTIAGQPVGSGGLDGIGSSARFNQPTGITADANTNLYVADFGNNTIRRMVLNGTQWSVYTVAGLSGVSGSADGTGTKALLNKPFGIAVDSSTNIFVSDSANNTIRGTFPTLISLAQLSNKYGLTWTNSFVVSYSLQFRTNLIQGSWSTLSNLATPSGSLLITNGTEKQMFYRVIQKP